VEKQNDSRNGSVIENSGSEEEGKKEEKNVWTQE
jgi:hypothetical protein